MAPQPTSRATLAYLYELVSQAGQDERLNAVLNQMGEALSRSASLRRFSILRSASDPNTFLFLEEWESAEAYQASGSSVPDDIMAALKSTLAAKPVRKVFDLL